MFALPPSYRRRLRTTNLVERLNEEIRRRTRVAWLFPNQIKRFNPLQSPPGVMKGWENSIG